LSWAYEGGAVADGGSISGTVKLSGEAPAVKTPDINKDQDVCGKTKTSDALIVGGDKSVRYAVVRLTNVSKGKKLDIAAKSVLNQEKCSFIPHVVVVPVGGTLQIKNSDPITHNVHTFSIENDPVNKAQPKSLPLIEEKFIANETIKTQCDIHKWMGAWIVATDHPYVAVTDGNGKFSLTDVPPGNYKMEIWHETLAKVTLDVSVKAKADTAVSVDLKKK
ncbi:MAG: hypothetical protein HY349_04645, partial [Nitrospirae bacterium]|nr:hypothetical protein [Nitrospirota bacterium]